MVTLTSKCWTQEECEGLMVARTPHSAPWPSQRAEPCQLRASLCLPISAVLLIVIAIINTKGMLAVFLSAQPLCL